MTNNYNHNENAEVSRAISSRFGYYSAILTSIVTIVTFGFGMIAVPISGANCPGDCVEYPYLDTLSQFPRDFLWMPLAIILVLTYLTLMVSIHHYAPEQKKIFSQAGLSLALVATVILVADYYIQFSVVPMSLTNGEMDGLPLLIQYNPHSVFLAMEEAGYLVMSLSFLFMAPVFANRSRLESTIRWIFNVTFILGIVSLAAISISYGLERQDRFEVVVLSINWLALIVSGILLSRVFRRRLKEIESSSR